MIRFCNSKWRESENTWIWCFESLSTRLTSSMVRTAISQQIQGTFLSRLEKVTKKKFKKSRRAQVDL